MSVSSPTEFSITRHPGNRFFRLTAVLGSLLLLAACATTPSGQDTIEVRAQARLDAVIRGDYPSAYAFYAPGFRSSTSVVDYEISMRMRRVVWTSAQVQGSECTPDACTVEVKVDYRTGSPVPGLTEWKSSQRVHERWVMTAGQWWFVPDA